MISASFLTLMYLVVIFAEAVAPYQLEERHVDYLFAPPQELYWFHEGEFVGPFVYGIDVTLDMDKLQWVYAEDRNQRHPLRFFCHDNDYPGAGYEFWGMVPASFHLVCPAKGGPLFLLGTDRLGRDMLSRIVYGARISLTLGLIGIAISFMLGISIGGVAGYYGGMVDNVVQRVIEVIRSFPMLPLLMTLSAILPVTWPPR
ncbi:hypothetical protein [Marinobacterium aestuariivivens]|uniref:ABC transmembrane type-1 domain-containing protein n=1 Tax=Marinobacterium aestuariivivens TaxID=1698799 RepID=A0ABW2A6Q7_9GAMM